MLRNYQSSLKNQIRHKWENGQANVMAVAPTGAGKTITMASLNADMDCPSLAIAHRQELVSQISVAFARQNIRHRIIAPNQVVNSIIEQHIEEVGISLVWPNAKTAVAGVDTLVKRCDPFFDTVQFWQTDEAHHILADNKWGKAIEMLPNATCGVGWTATPCRTDRKALRRGKGGIFDAMVVGPTMRELIDQQYLTEFRIYSLPQQIDMANVHVTSGGEFNGNELREAAHRSTITGDIVEHYLRLAAGKSGVTFAVDVALAEEHAEAFRAADVSAAVLHAKTPGRERIEIIRAFRNREIMQIVNVDVLGEGFDCPGIEVASFARPTMSYGLYVQQFGRALRPKEDKLVGLILDHVGNVIRHRGAPDGPRAWTLDSTKRKSKESEIPIKVCGNENCMQVYAGYERACPFCGWEPELGNNERGRPEAVEGDLTLYTPQLLAQLQNEVRRIGGEVEIPLGINDVARMGLERTWEARQRAQQELAAEIDTWAGFYHHGRGEKINTVYRRFWHTFGMDTLSALAQSGPKQREMMERVRNERS